MKKRKMLYAILLTVIFFAGVFHFPVGALDVPEDEGYGFIASQLVDGDDNLVGIENE